MFDQKSTGTERKQFLQSILHQDEGDDEEENEAPDDETINHMLARSNEEIELFAKMDDDRIKEENSLPEDERRQRLIQEDELPDWLLREDDDVSVYINYCRIFYY